VTDLLENTKEVFEMQANHKGIEIITQIDPLTPPAIEVDYNRV